MATSTTNGVLNATFIERVVIFFRLPYILGSLIVTTILGPPSALLLSYACTRDVGEALTRTTKLFLGNSLSVWQNILSLIIFSGLFIYVLNIIRFMRLKLIGSQRQISPLLPQGEEGFYNTFRQTSKSKYPILIGVLFMVLFTLLSLPEIPPNFKEFCIHPANTLFLVVSYPFWFIAFFTFVWMYLGSVRGLHALGTKSLTLKSFDKDRWLGVKPIGSLSLALASTYFSGLCLLALLPFVLSPDTPHLSYVLMLVFLVLLGIIFFFLPLYTIHKKMLAVKVREREVLRNEVSKVIQRPNESRVEDMDAMSDIKESLNRLTSVLKVEVTKNEVEAIPTWPIDMQILSRFLAMIISIITAIVARALYQYFLS